MSLQNKQAPPRGFKDHVTLLGQRWDIVYVDQLAGGSELGHSMDWQRTIALALDQCRRSLISTLVHECIHSYFRMFPGTSNEFRIQGSAEDIEEAVVVGMETAWQDLILHNPWLVKLVQGTKKAA